MVRRGPVHTQSREMLGRGVALVLREAVMRVNVVPFDHSPVAFYLCDDGGSRNRNGKSIAVNQRFLLDQHIELHGIEKQVIRRYFQLLQGGGHRLAAGLINIPRIDAAGVDFGNRPGQSMFSNSHRQDFSSLRQQFFRIVQTNDPALGVQDDGCGYDGTEEGPAPHFIQPGNALPAALASFALKSRGTLLLHHRGFYHVRI